MELNINKAPKELQVGLTEILNDFPARLNSNGPVVEFQKDNQLDKHCHKAESANGKFTIYYNNKNGAFRAFGRLMGALESNTSCSFEETAGFDMAGIMLDCSRNAVMKPEAVKHYLRRCALMGINTVMLYTEDTYKVDSEPFFGYLRGGYTKAELKELDDYANELGIEMFPCIQTLGHMEQFLQWDPAFKYRDTANVICAQNEDVYRFIETLIDTTSQCFKSKRIHIGMDEAFGLGSGNFKKNFGSQEPFEIMNKHLKRVKEICQSKGLTPMIWSDMYFRLGSETHAYYDEQWKISDQTITDIPKDVQLVYWDYYHTTKEHYQKFIDFHRKLGSTPIMAGGIWTWGRLWCSLPYSIKATDACMQACREEGIREVFMTMWGDDGAECNYLSALPGLQHFADLIYSDQVDPEQRAANFAGSCDLDFDSFLLSAQIDTNVFFEDPDGFPSSASKGLLYQDPFMPLMEPIVKDLPITEFYEDLSGKLYVASQKNDASKCLRHPALISRIISMKSDFRKQIMTAYKSNNKIEAKSICETLLVQLEKTVRIMWHEHRDTWMSLNKPFGWEVLESRYGTMLARLDTVEYRINQWIEGHIDKIAELEATLLNPWPDVKPIVPPANYARLKTPSAIK